MNLENLTNRERCLLRAIGMLKDRKNYYADAGEFSIGDSLTKGMYYAYDTTTAILDFAWNENWEALNQFDYFGEEK